MRSKSWIVLLLILLDQITKLFFNNRDFFLGPVHFHSLKNFGLGFSMDFGLLTNLAIVAAALIFFIYYYFKNKVPQIVFVLILAGAISNIADRLYLGYVRDFMDIGLGFTFNFADVFIVAGLLVVLIGDKFKNFQKSD